MANTKVYYINQLNQSTKQIENKQEISIDEIQLDLSSIDDDDYVLQILYGKIYQFLQRNQIITSELEKEYDINIQISKTLKPFIEIDDLYENKINRNGTYYFKLKYDKKFVPIKIKSGHNIGVTEIENGKPVLRIGEKKYVGDIDTEYMVPHGYGIETIGNTIAYIGEWHYGSKQGRGKIIRKYPSGSYIYEGEFYDNVFNGQGKEILPNGVTYDGIYENGIIIRGQINLTNGIIYEGSIINAKPDGYGSETVPSESVYTGEWKGGIKHGYGKIEYDQGTVVEGIFIEGKLPYGKIKSHHGLLYEGELFNYLPHGQGKEQYPDGSYFEGPFINGARHGIGKFTFVDQTTTTAEYICGMEKEFSKSVKKVVDAYPNIEKIIKDNQNNI